MQDKTLSQEQYDYIIRNISYCDNDISLEDVNNLSEEEAEEIISEIDAAIEFAMSMYEAL